MARRTDPWNHNVHYYPLILNAVPDGARRALDVGCGEGTLARELRRRVPDVTGIDLDETSIELAGAQNANDRIRYVRGDFLTYPFRAGVLQCRDDGCRASSHGRDRGSWLLLVRDLLKPGGVLCAVGLARSQLPRDIPIEVAGAVSHRIHLLTTGYWRHSVTDGVAASGDVPRHSPHRGRRSSGCPLPASCPLALFADLDQGASTVGGPRASSGLCPCFGATFAQAPGASRSDHRERPVVAGGMAWIAGPWHDECRSGLVLAWRMPCGWM